MSLHSDNETGMASEILAAIATANTGSAMPYGEDERTRAVEEKLAEVFEHDLRVFLVVSGTAANALALAALAPAYGAIYCHADAHILVDECGAPEFYSGGARLVPIDGADGKLQAANLARQLAAQRRDVHALKPSVLSLTQASEWGRVYTPMEIAALSQAARQQGLRVHMDGTRFANALVSQGCSPAALSWQAGVDVLCLGASKNGALAAEAVIFFAPELAEDFALRRKRGGHLLSKQRFIAAQFGAYLQDSRWLAYAAHANRMARQLAEMLRGFEDVELAYPVEANLVFVRVPAVIRQGLWDAGYRLNDWPEPDGRSLLRLVTAFDTQPEQIDRLRQTLARLGRARD